MVMLPMVSLSSSISLLPPVPLTGSRIGHAETTPTKQMTDRTLRKRRKKKASKEQLLRM